MLQEMGHGEIEDNLKQMYQMLDQKTVYTPTQKYFIEKHKEIYDVINCSFIVR